MAGSLTQASVSTQYVQVQVIATLGDGTPYSPGSDTVQMAFIPVRYVPANPQPSDWVAASWVSGTGGTWWAQCLVGPANGGVALLPGGYYVWVKVTDNPAVPELQGPVLNITGSGPGPSQGGGSTWVSSFAGRTGTVLPEAGDYAEFYDSSVATVTSSGPLSTAASTVLLNGADLAVTLPDATTDSGRAITLKLTAPFTTATIVPADGQVIDGYSSYPLTTQYQWVTLQSDGAGWSVVNAKDGGILTIPVSVLPGGFVNQPYSAQLTAAGGWPGYTWSVRSPSLPAGVTLSSDGLLSGTPVAAGVSSFVVQVTDSIGNNVYTSLSVTVTGGITLVSRGLLVEAISGLDVHPAFGQATTAGNFLIAYLGSNGAITTASSGWTIVAGAVTGRAIAYKLNCSAGETAPVFSTGASDIWAYLEEWQAVATTSALTQYNGSNVGDQSWTATLASPDSAAGELVVACGYWNGSNTGGVVTLNTFNDSLNGPMTGALIQGASGFGQYFAGVAAVSGPTGSFAHQVTMTDSVFAGGDGIIATFTPANAGPPGSPTVTTTSPLPDGSTDQPYTFTLAAEGGTPPYTWSLASGSMPAGLTLSPAGAISGTPTAAASNSLHVRVTDNASATGTATLGLTVDQTPPITFTTSAAQQVSQGYSPVSGITGVTTPVYLNPNVWNPVTGWSQTLSAVDPTDWWVTSNFPAGNTAVSAFPSNGCYFSELPLSSFTKIVSSFSEQMNATAGSQCWAGFDCWLNNWANEIMMHTDLARFNKYDNTPLAQNVSFGGSYGVPVQSWDLHFYGTSEYVWQPANNAWNMPAGSVDVLAMLNWMVTNGFLPATNTVTAIGWGWEICSTGGLDQFFKTSAFTLDAEHT